MKQELKELLLRDLCARLPYRVKVNITKEWFYDKIEPYNRRLDCDVIKSIRENRYTVKPYLRSMLSMTEEEKKELNEITVINCNEFEGCSTLFDEEGFDWLNSHHFDYRGLIERGLALEAKEGMYNLNK